MDPNELVGRQIDRYLIKEHIDRGGMADVYLAYDVDLDRKVALKVILPSLAQVPEFGARFRREARATARVNHPNVVQIYTNGVTQDNSPYIALEFIAGGSLADHMDRLKKMGKRMSEMVALKIARDIALGLQAAHKAGIIHRDLKPNNVLLRSDGTAVVSDLGIATVLYETTRLTQTGTFQGTPQYIAPEQARSDVSVDARSDIYSLGVIIFELLTGEPPFDADSPWGIVHQHIYEPPPLDDLRRDVLKTTATIVSTCLQKTPEQRFRSAGELLSAIEAALAAEGPSRGSIGPPPAPGVNRRRPIPLPRFVIYLAIGVVVLLLAFALYRDRRGLESGLNQQSAETRPTALFTQTAMDEALASAESDLTLTVVGTNPAENEEVVPKTNIGQEITETAPALTSTALQVDTFPEGLIAYACGSDNKYQIRLSNSRNGTRLEISNQPPNSIVPAFSPDGSKIVYRSDASGTWQIYISNLEGGSPRLVTDDITQNNYEAVWSPDSSQLAFVSDRTGSKQIYVMSTAGNSLRRLTFDGANNDDPSWSVDNVIAFESNASGEYGIYIIDVSGGRPIEIISLGDSSSTPAWSTDGELLAFEVRSGSTRQIWISGKDGKNPQLITYQGTINERPTWSSDGRWLAFHSNYQQSTADRFDIWIINVVTQELQRITTEGNCYNPTWSLPNETSTPVSRIMYTIYQLGNLANAASDFISPPTGDFIFSGTPFSLSEEVFKSQASGEPHQMYPTSILLPITVPSAYRVHLLINSGNSFIRYNGAIIGSVSAYCDEKVFKIVDLQLGRDIREWHVADNVVSSATNVINVWQDGVGHIDLLSLDLPSACRQSRLTGIEIKDLSINNVNSIDPAVILAGITVEHYQ